MKNSVYSLLTENTGDRAFIFIYKELIKLIRMSGRHQDYIIAVDFDGTLCYDKYPEVGKPRKDIIDLVKYAQRAGAKIILYTCREGKFLEEALRVCEKVGLKFDAVNENLPSRIKEYDGVESRKLSFDELWDDKCVSIETDDYEYDLVTMDV